MENWFFLSIISALLFWLNDFIKKIVAKKGINKNNFILYFAFVQVIASVIYFIYMWSTFYMTLLFWFLVFIRRILGVEKNITMIESLKFIDSSLFFPAHKLIKIWWWLIAWMFLFWEYLDSKEIIFLIVGILTVLLLWYKKETFKNKDIKKGIFYLLISSFILVVTSTINKFMSENHDPALYVFLSSLVWFLYIALKVKFSKTKFVYNIQEFKYWLITWIIWFLAFLLLIIALKDWKLVIVQLIETMAIIIPIFLSFLILKEDVNKVKLVWLFLFIVNMIYFYLC